jgi:hypothetical protein
MQGFENPDNVRFDLVDVKPALDQIVRHRALRNRRETQSAATVLSPCGDACQIVVRRSERKRTATGLGRVPPAPALGLAALRAVLFLNADKAKTAPVLSDDSGALYALRKSLQQLLE